VVIGLNLNVTRRCNLKCKYCGATADCRSSQEENLQDLSTDKVVSILRYAGDAGARVLTLAGGEPFVREDLPEILYAAGDYGYVVGLLTNGTLIDEEAAATLARSGVLYVRVSMESPNEEVYYNGALVS